MIGGKDLKINTDNRRGEEDSGYINIFTGNTTDGSTGNITVSTGSATNGVAGSIRYEVGSENLNEGSSLSLKAGNQRNKGESGGSVILISGFSEETSSGKITIRTRDSGAFGVSGSLKVQTGSSTNLVRYVKVQ